MAVRLAGKPVTVKYIPLPSFGLVGGVQGRVTRLAETLGNPVVVTTNEPGKPVGKVALFELIIVGASLTFKVKF